MINKIQNSRTTYGDTAVLCVNTYFDTICVQIIKMLTAKLTDKLEFIVYKT